MKKNLDNSSPNINLVRQHNCIVCGARGNKLYADLHDELFGTPGEWSISQCEDNTCNTLWLDPRPVNDDIEKLYDHYYTHDENIGSEKSARNIYKNIILSLAQRKYGGIPQSLSFSEQLASYLLYLHPSRLCDRDAKSMSIPVKKDGQLLEIGFGSGEYLEFLTKLGWITQGLEFDIKVVDSARQAGLNVHWGSLESQHYESNNFDAVVARHVIEHLVNPVEFLEECHRIMKSGSKLVLYTPNAIALGHKLFKSHWRGLEIPRHMNIFSITSLSSLVSKAGFEVVKCDTTGQGGNVIYESIRLARGTQDKPKSRLLNELFNWLEWGVSQAKNNIGEELRIIAVKP